MQISRIDIPAAHVASLTWCGDKLVDWVSGGIVYHLDGRSENPHVAWRFRFDAACATGDARYAVIYQRLGTKALLLREGGLLRELNRSYYHAHVYEYPVCIWRNADGRVLLAHCPDSYCQIDIEDAESGERLTRGTRDPYDFFHSRLMVNSAGTRLMSAGWVWHPLDGVAFYDLTEALCNPAHLDDASHSPPGSLHVGLAEVGSACWQTADRALIGASSEEEEEDEQKEVGALIGEPRLHPRGIAVYDVVTNKYVRSVVLDEVPGAMMPVGENHAVCFFRHARLVSLESGEIVARWEDLDTGNQVSSIIQGPMPPTIALDASHHRFAVAGPDKITVVQIGPPR